MGSKAQFDVDVRDGTIGTMGSTAANCSGQLSKVGRRSALRVARTVRVKGIRRFGGDARSRIPAVRV